MTANLNRLQDLVTQASGTGSLFGFVGGVQTVAVWGIILVVVTGFIFLALYFKRLQLTPQPDSTSLNPKPASSTVSTGHLTPLTLPQPHPNWQMPVIIAVVVVVTSGGTILLTRLARPRSEPVINQIASSPIPTPSPIEKPIQEDVIIKNPKDVLGENSDDLTPVEYLLTVPPDSSVNIRNQPSSDADIIMSIKESVSIYIFKESGEWRQIGFTSADSPKGYWVHSKFIEEK